MLWDVKWRQLWTCQMTMPIRIPPQTAGRWNWAESLNCGRWHVDCRNPDHNISKNLFIKSVSDVMRHFQCKTPVSKRLHVIYVLALCDDLRTPLSSPFGVHRLSIANWESWISRERFDLESPNFTHTSILTYSATVPEMTSLAPSVTCRKAIKYYAKVRKMHPAKESRIWPLFNLESPNLIWHRRSGRPT